MDDDNAENKVTVSGSSLSCACLKEPDDCSKCIQSAAYCAFCTSGESGSNGCIESSFDNEDACKGYIDMSSDCPSGLVKDHPFLRAVAK